VAAITSILELQFKPGTMDDALALFGIVMPQVRAFDGCTSALVAQDREDPDRLFIVATWASFERHEAYQEWRLGDGILPELEVLSHMLTGPPRDTVCDTRIS
jgi:quinol monooxygenase YgiN